MTKDQRTLYDNAGEVRNTDAAMRWSIAQLFLVLHSALFTVLTTRFSEDATTRIILSLVGAVLGILWGLITDRTQELLMYWNGRLRAFEQSEQHAIYVFGDPEYRTLQQRSFTTYNILSALITLIVFVWIPLFLYFIYSWRKPF